VVKLGKAARGKRRWLGVAVDDSLTNRSDVEQTVAQFPALSHARLYDFVPLKSIDSEEPQYALDVVGKSRNSKEGTESTESKVSENIQTELGDTSDHIYSEIDANESTPLSRRNGLAIFSLPLADCAAARDVLNQNDSLFVTLTTSGKIRLVRERLGVPIRRRRR
jgi:hypothetical protein